MAASTSVTVTTSATQIAAANTNRLNIVLHNAGTTTVYLNDSSSATTANGIPLLPNTTFLGDNSGTKLYTGAFFGIVDSGTADVRVWEREIQS